VPVEPERVVAEQERGALDDADHAEHAGHRQHVAHVPALPRGGEASTRSSDREDDRVIKERKHHDHLGGVPAA
jgi:hypothetical protein